MFLTQLNLPSVVVNRKPESCKNKIPGKLRAYEPDTRTIQREQETERELFVFLKAGVACSGRGSVIKILARSGSVFVRGQSARKQTHFCLYLRVQF